MTQIEFAKCVKRLSSFYFKDFSSDDLSVWYELFKDIKVKTLILSKYFVIYNIKNNTGTKSSTISLFIK